MDIIFINNRFKKTKEANVSVFSSFSRGYGIFETMRTFSKIPFQTKEHVERLFTSAKKINLKIKYKKEEIIQMIEKAAKKSPHKTQRIKIMAIVDHLIITSSPQKIDQKIYQGISCLSVKAERSLPEVKSISYIASYLSHEAAVKKGAFDAILINEKNEVTEGAYSNLFWFEGDTLCTRKDQVLKGITRATILKISPFKIQFKTIKLSELKKKTEVFLTTSISGIVPIIKIDNTKIGTSKTGTNTKTLLEKFNKLTASFVDSNKK